MITVKGNHIKSNKHVLCHTLVFSLVIFPIDLLQDTVRMTKYRKIALEWPWLDIKQAKPQGSKKNLTDINKLNTPPPPNHFSMMMNLFND